MIEPSGTATGTMFPSPTNLASAEMLIMGLQRGDLDWREMLHNKTRY